MGAGISGLAASQTLKAKGVRVTIIEAMSRIGGRIHSIPIGKQIFEEGAYWIHGVGHGAENLPEYDNKLNPLTEIANDHNFQLVMTMGTSSKTTTFDYISSEGKAISVHKFKEIE